MSNMNPLKKLGLRFTSTLVGAATAAAALFGASAVAQQTPAAGSPAQASRSITHCTDAFQQRIACPPLQVIRGGNTAGVRGVSQGPWTQFTERPLSVDEQFLNVAWDLINAEIARPDGNVVAADIPDADRDRFIVVDTRSNKAYAAIRTTRHVGDLNGDGNIEGHFLVDNVGTLEEQQAQWSGANTYFCNPDTGEITRVPPAQTPPAPAPAPTPIPEEPAQVITPPPVSATPPMIELPPEQPVVSIPAAPRLEVGLRGMYGSTLHDNKLDNGPATYAEGYLGYRLMGEPDKGFSVGLLGAGSLTNDGLGRAIGGAELTYNGVASIEATGGQYVYGDPQYARSSNITGILNSTSPSLNFNSSSTAQTSPNFTTFTGGAVAGTLSNRSGTASATVYHAQGTGDNDADVSETGVTARVVAGANSAHPVVIAGRASQGTIDRPGMLQQEDTILQAGASVAVTDRLTATIQGGQREVKNGEGQPMDTTFRSVSGDLRYQATDRVGVTVFGGVQNTEFSSNPYPQVSMEGEHQTKVAGAAVDFQVNRYTNVQVGAQYAWGDENLDMTRPGVITPGGPGRPPVVGPITTSSGFNDRGASVFANVRFNLTPQTRGYTPDRATQASLDILRENFERQQARDAARAANAGQQQAAAPAPVAQAAPIVAAPLPVAAPAPVANSDLNSVVFRRTAPSQGLQLASVNGARTIEQCAQEARMGFRAAAECNNLSTPPELNVLPAPQAAAAPAAPANENRGNVFTRMFRR